MTHRLLRIVLLSMVLCVGMMIGSMAVANVLSSPWEVTYGIRQPGSYQWHVIVMDVDRQLTYTLSREWRAIDPPALAPNREIVALQQSSAEIDIIHLADNRQYALDDAVFPAWSADSGSIVVRDQPHLYRIDLTADDAPPTPQRLSQFAYTLSEFLPRWSPDGEKIAFEVNIEGDSRIHVISTTDEGATPVNISLITDSQDYLPVWSPDSQQIAFVALVNNNLRVYVMNADGSNRREPAALSSLNIGTLVWSPDGEHIAVAVSAIGRFRLYVVATNLPARDDSPRIVTPAPVIGDVVWSPSGESIAYTSRDDGELYVVDVSTGNIRRLTNDPLTNIILP